MLKSDILIFVLIVCCVLMVPCEASDQDNMLLLNKIIELECRLKSVEDNLSKCSCLKSTAVPTTTTTTPLTVCPESWIQFEKSCYFLSTTNASFAVAQVLCEKDGAHLAYIENAEENKYIKQYLQEHKVGVDVWFGLCDEDREGEWKYYGTKRVATFFDWNQYEPSNDRNNEDCAQFRASIDYRWNDKTCSVEIYFLCEKEL